MSTAHGQPGLSSDQRSTIRSTILSSRRTLENELRRQLEKYGIYEDKKLPLDNLAHLSADELHTRKKLDAAVERELESTEGDLERSITNYVREATKTYLNRFVALKTIEVRGLVEETITERAEYGNRSYMHHTVAEVAGELTDAPDDGFGAALDLAYQEIGAEIRMIFEDSEHTAIDLDAQVREEILDDLDAIDDGAWESDEALGWVYQYFGEEEREDIDDRVDEENYKIAGTDIATKTQLFTPRYIVEWMVDNSLGRTWLEMQGERTNIDDEDNCFYLAPVEESLIDRETKSVEDITVLDPACGSGHMLFYAFDVLYQMYLEEGEVLERHIPREILRNNLYGVDIDSGAAQIAALSLYLKAKTKSPDVSIEQINITSADAVLINGTKKQEVLDRTDSELEKEILDQIWTSFEHIREWGSLVRVEQHIEDIIEQYRDDLKAEGQSKFTQSGGLEKQSSVVSFTDEKSESWESVKERLLENTREIARAALNENNPVDEMFAEEVSKSVELLDVLIRDYDVVVANPPYLGSGKMGDNLKQYIKDGYAGTRDIYAAFIQRSWEFAKSDGYASLVTPENYMFSYSYRKLRRILLQNHQFLEGAHLSGYSFSMKDRPFTISFLLRNSDPTDVENSRFYRMTHEQDKYDTHEKKIDGLNALTSQLRENNTTEDVYTVNPNDFLSIGRQPFLYWFGDSILNLFSEYPAIEDSVEVKQGLATGDDDRFVRKHWEVNQDELGGNYVPYQKSGSSQPYYDTQRDYLLWKNSGEEVKEYDGSYIRNSDYYFRKGVSFRGFGNYAVARSKPDNMIFYHKSHFVYSPEISDEYLLGYGNSTLVRFLLNGINPSLNFEVGDIKRLPINPEPEQQAEVERLVERAMDSREKLISLDETSDEFDQKKFIDCTQEGVKGLLYYEDKLNAEVGLIHGLIDPLIYDAYSIPSEHRERLSRNLPKNLADYPIITNLEYETGLELSSDEIPERELASEEYQRLLSDIADSPTDLREAAEDLEISPITIAEGRYTEETYDQDRLEKTAGRILSYCLGTAVGHWSTDQDIESVDDGIITFDENADENVDACIQDCLDTLFMDSQSIQSSIEGILGTSVGEWLRESFFRYHHCKEYRRRGQRIPIYWQLESPNGAFSCFVYYHKIDSNTLPKLRGQYLDPHIDSLKNELDSLRKRTSSDNPDKKLLNRKESVQESLNDVKEFREIIDEMIDDNVSVDADEGIWENIKQWDQYEVLETGLPKLKSSYSR
ncbi:BREX-1 system adenine-specific DNA-methyltransferase PglX [Haloarcula laminariae]|uniref:BREX-1 system adenine-specific DNA-methyltransferase PglX n=1 Tax=Haloarcula laminariae TaxID=2961577 RepID=UPI0021C989E6|nr:BREX-1 system adenine-specific DNA-methyltransferase PglX [Halomicroarcula laminariae]